MPMRALALGGLAVVAAISVLPQPARAAIAACGVTDGGPGDLDPRRGRIALTCARDGGAFAGSVTEVSTPTARRIVIRGTLTGEGALPLQTSYGGLAWRSTATLGALVLGNARGGEGAASVVLTAFATSFSANSAAARATATDAAMNAVDLRHGEVAREGSLTGTLGWDAAGGAIELTGSEIAIRVPAPRRAIPPQGARLTPLGEAPAPVAPVPEPSTWMMMILGFGAVGSVLRRRTGLRSPDRNRVPATRRSARRPARR